MRKNDIGISINMVTVVLNGDPQSIGVVELLALEMIILDVELLISLGK
jgi:hypothetical protein